MLVYDSTREATLDSIPRWLSELREQYVSFDATATAALHQTNICVYHCKHCSAHKDISLLLVGNKCDSEDDPNKQVSAESAESLADELHIKCMETSAKTGMNVEKAFVTIVESIYANHNALATTAQQPKHPHNVQLNSQTGKQSQLDNLKDKCCS